ncbi:MAG: pyrroline-5-carboxylate reductase dimerization domain-containing protein, partial [Oscillospiraceae bacterium]
AKLADFAERGFSLASSEGEIARSCHYVLLAVKPQIFEAVLVSIAAEATRHNVFVSIGPGISGKWIKEILCYDAKIVLAMPNTPLLLGCGATALSRVAPTTAEEFAVVHSFFDGTGITVETDNNLMREVVALNGSSPALFYLVVQTMVDRAVEEGFDPDTANRLVCQAMVGASKMMLESGLNHQELIDEVCTKGGTTIAMVDAMKKQGIRSTLRAGMDACTKRVYELSK